MTSFRRNDLVNVSVQKDTHAGLWLDKYLGGDGEDAKKKLVDDVIGIQTSEAYRQYFKRWKAALVNLCGAENCRVAMKEAMTEGRLAVNLGAEGVLETSIALHHTYGIPYIPGSAIKGLAAHYVLEYLKDDPLWHKKAEAFVTLFGDTSNAGYVTFYDALYVPGSGKGLVPDVITVHHPHYYQGTAPEYYQTVQAAPPADWDSPTPIPFITASGKFLIAISGPVEWVKTAFEILKLALERSGVGAKTSSGYGRMLFVGEDSASTSEPYIVRKNKLLNETPPANRFRGTVHTVDPSGRHGRINPVGGGQLRFVHVNQIISGQTELHVGQVVEFRMGKFQGNDQAQEVKILLEPEN